MISVNVAPFALRGVKAVNEGLKNHELTMTKELPPASKPV
jgi:hypothetical protein